MRAMASTDSGAQVQSCPSCGEPVSTAGLEPFGKVDCPSCGYQLRVERVFDDNFVVVEPLGTGGMGSVYKARDARLNRFVAIKLLRKEFAGDSSFTAKLKDEARITASIQHPHVLEVYSVGEDHGQFYVVMELVDGGSLDDRMEDEKRISELQTLELGLQVAQGLQAALKAGLIHRDIKPGNILFADRSRAKIVDFGLALLAAQHAETEGEIWGTPYYVAPERLTGAKEDFRSDLYSLGATLFHAVSGRPTFESETQSAAELQTLKSDPISLKEVAPDISDETVGVIDRMLRPNPADRQGSYNDLISELRSAHAAYLAREEELKTRWGWPLRLAVLLGVLTLLGAVGYGISFGWRHRPQMEFRSPLASGPTATPPPATAAPDQVQAARRELEAGHYASAEALFREMVPAQREFQPVVELCAGLQLWERGQFAQAATAFQSFVSDEPPSSLAWLRNFKSLAQDRLKDFELLTEWEKKRSATRDPDVALARIRAVQKKLKAKGALSFQFADEEAKLAAQVSDLSKERSAEEKKQAEEDAPTLRNALVAEKKAIAGYQFERAVDILEKTKLKSSSVQAERESELRRARWLAEWKEKLIGDINQIGYGGVVTDVHGVRYDGSVRRATASKLELKTRYGSVMTDWRNLSPKMLLAISTAFIRPAGTDVPERQWLSAIFASQMGEKEAAHELATKAAEAKSEYRELLPRYFPEAKK